ncbi:MAG: CPBP family intramembrane metalloprotease [Candidatus Marinimicrobia bacterium]|nr:CPBP family intramembrane metalloprotease [Candidatus Neomarinimicrobiota bacterium]
MLQLFLVLFLVITASFLLIGMDRFTGQLSLRFSERKFINVQAKRQLGFVLLTAVILFLVYLLNPANFFEYFRLGDLNATAGQVPWLGITEGDSWLEVGLSFAGIVTIATGLFMFLTVRSEGGSWSVILQIFPWILFFSLTNSFAEEIIFRFTLVSPLDGTLPAAHIMLLSAALFGVPHYFGMPKGVIGVLMAGFLGWLLAKSVLETHGIFWAWSIHFIQDVVIFAGMFAVSAAKESG